MEMNQDTLEKMLGMNLKGMYYAFKTSLETHRTESMTTDQFVSWLVSSEWDDRRNRAVERAIRQASFRYKATIEEIDCIVLKKVYSKPVNLFQGSTARNIRGQVEIVSVLGGLHDLVLSCKEVRGKVYQIMFDLSLIHI